MAELAWEFMDKHLFGMCRLVEMAFCRRLLLSEKDSVKDQLKYVLDRAVMKRLIQVDRSSQFYEGIYRVAYLIPTKGGNHSARNRDRMKLDCNPWSNLVKSKNSGIKAMWKFRAQAVHRKVSCLSLSMQTASIPKGETLWI